MRKTAEAPGQKPAAGTNSQPCKWGHSGFSAAPVSQLTPDEAEDPPVNAHYHENLKEHKQNCYCFGVVCFRVMDNKAEIRGCSQGKILPGKGSRVSKE